MNDNKYYSVSRIEDDVAVLEFPDGTFNEVSLSHLPSDVAEGNILIIGDNGEFVYDYNEEQSRKSRLLNLQDDIFG